MPADGRWDLSRRLKIKYPRIRKERTHETGLRVCLNVSVTPKIFSGFSSHSAAFKFQYVTIENDCNT
jgi:hypothetical protein